MPSSPFEIIAAPFTLWWGPVGEAFPDLADTPAGNWTQVGTSGDQNYNEEGVTVSHEQTLEYFRMLGGTGPRKVTRTEEMLLVRATVHDMSLEQYRLSLNNNTVATTAAGSGTAGQKALNMYRGLDVQLMALLARGDVSPEGDGWKMQYQIPVCCQAGNPEPVFAKGAPAGLALEFAALEDPNAASEAERFGKLLVQHQTAL